MLVSVSPPGAPVPLPRPAVAVAAGDTHSCAALDDASVWCWGGNSHGQLGDGSFVARAKPARVALPPARGVAAGERHTCALLADGGVRCWGRNRHGELGDGSLEDRPRPVPVAALAGATAIATGEEHSCSLVRGGEEVWCWGRNDDGQLGAATAEVAVSRPVRVPGVRGAVSIAPGESHTCALLADGGVLCWGANDEGQLGVGGRRGPGPWRAAVAGAVELASGEAHVCARLRDGAVHCWGRNHYGQLGDRTRTSRAIPGAVSGVGPALAIAAGEDHTCALLPAGGVVCWGKNEGGQLGDGSRARRSAPVPVAGVSAARAVAAGEAHTCALERSGNVRCWGSGEQGQLGWGPLRGTARARRIPSLTGVRALAAGGDHTCAIREDGRVSCWGRKDRGQLGDGTTLPTTGIVEVRGLRDATVLAAGEDHTCAVDARRRLFCWGDNDWGELGDGTTRSAAEPVPVPIGAVAAIAVGKGFTCAALASGEVHCWGRADRGQLGDGTRQARARPAPVRGLERAVSVAAGEQHACAIVAGGDVRCWGRNREGQLGDGTRADRTTPVRVAGLSGARALALGEAHGCALVAGGRVRCWGENGRGEMWTVPLDGAAVAIASGEAHVCALLASGRVRCFGANARGQLGDGTRAHRTRPVAVEGLGDVLAISAGEAHSCAVRRDGSVACWGGFASVPEDALPAVTDEAETTFRDFVRDLDWSGYAELRLRDHLDVTESRSRNRFRFRVRLSGEVAWRGLFVGLGIRTASEGVAGLTSDNFTVDGSAWPVPIVNLAYLGYRTSGTRGALLVAGGYTMNSFQLNPLIREAGTLGKETVQSLRVFDRDFTPVGATAMGTVRLGRARLFGTAALWALGPQGGAGRDLMAGVQIGAVRAPLLGALGFYHFGRPGGELARFAVEQGNTAAAEGRGLLHEYRVASLTTRLDLARLTGWRGASLQLEYTRNFGAPARNQAVYAQIKGALGRSSQVLLDGFWVEADATMAALADSDREFTDVRGGSTAIAYALTPSFSVTFNYFALDRIFRGGPLEHRLFLSFTSRVGD